MLLSLHIECLIWGQQGDSVKSRVLHFTPSPPALSITFDLDFVSLDARTLNLTSIWSRLENSKKQTAPKNRNRFFQSAIVLNTKKVGYVMVGKGSRVTNQ